MQAVARAFFARRLFKARARAVRHVIALLTVPPLGCGFATELAAALAVTDELRIYLPVVTAAAVLLRRCSSAVCIQHAERSASAHRRVRRRRWIVAAIVAELGGSRVDARALAAAVREARNVGLDVPLVRRASEIVVRAAARSTAPVGRSPPSFASVGARVP
jgi:hypothetical protein